MSTATKSTAPEPRLKAAFQKQVVPEMMKKFSWENPFQVPRVKKIVVNIGVSEARENAKVMDLAADELTASEILDRKTEPLQLARMVEGLRHRPAKHAPAVPQYQPEQPTRTAPAPAGSGFEDIDSDDIPFRDPLAYRGVHLAL